MFSFPSAKDVPIDVTERVEKNIEEGRGISFGGARKQGGVFDFASSTNAITFDLAFCDAWCVSRFIVIFISVTFFPER